MVHSLPNSHRSLGKSFYFMRVVLHPLALMVLFRPRLLLGGPSAMSLRALLYRRPSEPAAIEIIFDRAIYPVRMRRHRQARRYTLRIDAASREVVLTIPPRGTVKEARELDRGAARTAAKGGAVCSWHRSAAAWNPTLDFTPAGPARHSLDRVRH